MILLRCYQVLDTLVVEASATVTHDPYGQPAAPVGIFLGRVYYDGHSALDSDEISRAVWAVLSPNDRAAGEAFGGWHNLL